MLSKFNFLFERISKEVAKALRCQRRILTIIFPPSRELISSQFVLFSYLPKKFRKPALITFTAVQTLEKNVIEQLSNYAQCSIEKDNQKRELMELANILLESPNLTNNHFEDKSSISDTQKGELLVSENPTELIKKYLKELNKIINLKRIRIDPFQFHALLYRLSGLYSATVETETSLYNMRMIFSVNQEGMLQFFAILPSHEYELLNSIIAKAESLKEVQSFFEKYNVYWFNPQLSPEDQYRCFFRKCNRLKYSKAVIAHVESKKPTIIKQLKKSKAKHN